MKNIDKSTVTFSKVCAVSAKTYSITVPFDKYRRLKNRKELIQNIFPELTREEREFLKTGTTPEEWKEMFRFEELDDNN
tara:strand:- start:291 stop:527 length:237 start_codon:yes stop_codon:yes gene_type:complete